MTYVQRLLTGLAASLLFVSLAPAQPVPFDSDRWTITAQENRLEPYNGQPSLYLKGGTAVLEDAAFTDGTIEFDIAFPGDRAFTGVFWRWQDPQNFEDFYFRPHQSGNPDANQYTPVFNGVSGWQLYYGDGYAAPVAYPFDEWIPVKIVVSGKQAEVYIQDMERPALFVSELKRPVASGGVGIKASNLAPARFANFRVTRQSSPPLQGTPQAPIATPPGTITSWAVSSLVNEADLGDRPYLSKTDKTGLTWTSLAAEPTGLMNLARVQGIDGESNTAFARVTITSEREQIKRLNFGFSDRARVYLNDRLLYSGDDRYESRDYRYLGTIGFFDAVYLPLQAGPNELWIAVSEGFGGWGLQGRLEDMEGITVGE